MPPLRDRTGRPAHTGLPCMEFRASGAGRTERTKPVTTNIGHGSAGKW